MVTNIPHMDDLDVAEYLDIPIFAPEPEVAHLYSTKSGCKRIFASANVDMPPSEYDVYSLGQVRACVLEIICLSQVLAFTNSLVYTKLRPSFY